MPNLPIRQRNKLLRLVSRGLQGIGVPLSANCLRLRDCRDLHEGKTAFIIGNGPSLTLDDLERLKGRLTFASNKIFLAYEATDWRPDYYFVMDRLVAENNKSIINTLTGPKFIAQSFADILGNSSEVMWLDERGRNESVVKALDGNIATATPYFSRSIVAGVDAGWTVLYTQLQVAFHMGVSNVVLLGVDFHFDLPKETVATSFDGYEKALKAEGECNHFHPRYREPGEIWAVPRLDCQLAVFRRANEVYLKSGRNIVNASRRTKLTVFPRVALESCL
jgi:hypothetical protein